MSGPTKPAKKLDTERCWSSMGAGIVGTRRLVEVARLCEKAGSKLVLAGDERQLPSIDAGGDGSQLCQRVRPVLGGHGIVARAHRVRGSRD